MNILVLGPDDGHTFTYIYKSFIEMGHNATIVDPRRSESETLCYPPSDFVLCSRTPSIGKYADRLKSNGSKLYCWNVDIRETMQDWVNEFGPDIYSLFKACDCVYTVMNGEEIDLYGKHGIKAKHLIQGCYPPCDEYERKGPYEYEVTFLGNIDDYHQRYANRTTCLRSIAKSTGLLQLEGYGTKARHIYAHSKINIGSDAFYKRGTGPSVRNFKIMAAGGFLLTNWMEGMEEFYPVDKVFAVYNSPEQAAEKAKYYLEHDAEREEIAAEGKRWVLEHNKYSQRLQEIIEDHVNAKNNTNQI